jgi:hypothetical protein
VRFGNNNFKPQPLVGVDMDNTMSSQTQSDINNILSSSQVQVIGTQAVIRVGDRVYALPAFESGFPMQAETASGFDSAKQGTTSDKLPTQVRLSSAPLPSQRCSTQSPFPGADVQTLEAQWSAKKEELRYVEQTEVLQADHQPPTWRTGIIAKKKSLILEIDSLRKQITAAKEVEESKGDVSLPQSSGLTTAAAVTAPSVFVPQLPQSLTPAVYSNIGGPINLTAPSPYQPMMIYQPFAGAQAFPTDVQQFGRDGQLFAPGENGFNGNQISKTLGQGTNAAQSPGSVARRSHAVPIKKPDEAKKPTATISILDPKSPTYEPVMKSNGQTDSAKAIAPPTPSPVKESPLRSTEVDSAKSHKHKERAISQQPSLSSIDTTDFFPTNTHEHSTTRVAPSKLSKQSSRENTAAPTTPEKSWPNGPWNPSSERQANRAGPNGLNDSALKLTSWPEAFGKHSSIPSGINGAITESGSSSALLRQNSAQYTGSNLNWPPIPSKPVSYVPSTYQEGYQAGWDHRTLPDSVEVLEGFADGIKAYLKEKKLRDKREHNGNIGLYAGQNEYDTSSARSSLRGYLSGATLHDSASSLTENFRYAKVNAMSSGTQRQCGFSPKGDDSERPVAYTLYNEASRKSPIYGKQSNEERGRPELAQSGLGFPRQFSGNQIQTRAYGTPVTLQRHVPAVKEYPPGFSNDRGSQSARPGTHQRFSGLDGAMDDLSGLVVDKHTNEKSANESADGLGCGFKAPLSKGKQPKVPSSPTKPAQGNGKYSSSPSKGPSSPKKSGEHSPAKAKLESVTNKLRRPRKDDPRTMSPEEKQVRSDKWRRRFQHIKAKEAKEISDYLRDNPRKNI